MTNREEDPRQERDPAAEGGAERGRDDRRRPVNPADNPAPQSPEADHEAVRKGEETLERVKPY
jgi:hypothetical protein